MLPCWNSEFILLCSPNPATIIRTSADDGWSCLPPGCHSICCFVLTALSMLACTQIDLHHCLCVGHLLGNNRKWKKTNLLYLFNTKFEVVFSYIIGNKVTISLNHIKRCYPGPYSVDLNLTEWVLHWFRGGCQVHPLRG